MKILDYSTKFAHLGKPGSAFTKGFQRRLDKVMSKVDLHDKKILDQGCGEGVWLEKFAEITSPENVYGFDVDPELITEYKKQIRQGNSAIPESNLVVSPAEKLPFDDNFFDIVFSNEVLEHVEDDQKAVTEAMRVLKPGGYFIIFTPNRGWPFETHGMFFRGKYYWGNIPFLPWFPKRLYKIFAPHVQNYWNRDIQKMFTDQNVDFVFHSHVFPGFDGAVRRWGFIGKSIQRVFHILEKTPLHWFGISHFVILQKR